MIEKNAQLRSFDSYLKEREDVLPNLVNIEAFRQDIWKSYIKAQFDSYRDLVDKFAVVEEQKGKIESAARDQRTDWEIAIDKFNERFFVPFKLVAKNKAQVCLGNEPLLSLGFEFDDGTGPETIERKTLLEVLSNGEKKAFYILNVMFELEARKKAGTDTIVVFDDVADSFDYRNKFAIIQYMHDIKEDTGFKQIILTHNFDFFRTVNSRLRLQRHSRMAFKESAGLLIESASSIEGVFVKHWKSAFFTDDRKKIACIPFIRNMIEYSDGTGDADYITLTSLLHWKPNSISITCRDLDDIFKRAFKVAGNPSSANGSALVVDVIGAEAVKCLAAGAGINLDNKIVLAIASRISAERFMISKINDPVFVAGIKSNQASALFRRFKADFPQEEASIKVLHKVMLMTPENIHLNSFMFEPLLDMSDEHLRQLYSGAIALK